jgi:amino acid synthesis protein
MAGGLNVTIRKTVLIKETIETDGHGKACDPITRVAAIAVVKNPFAGQFAEDLSPLFDLGGQLGERLTNDAVELLAGPPISYGKAAIVGISGDMEHGGAMIHPKLGKPMRAAVGGGKALIPSNVKVASTGTPIDLPLGHKDEAWSFDHFDTMTVMVADAPRADEIVMLVAVSDGTRPNPRVGKGPITD